MEDEKRHKSGHDLEDQTRETPDVDNLSPEEADEEHQSEQPMTELPQVTDNDKTEEDDTSDGNLPEADSPVKGTADSDYKDKPGNANEKKEDIVMTNTRSGRKNTLGDGANIQESDVASVIYSELSRLFGQGSQLFCLEMPGRVLNQLDYAYPIESHNSSQLKKPYAVGENEFRLTDNMIDIAPIVAGPNGSRVSTSYDVIINNYAPKITDRKKSINSLNANPKKTLMNMPNGWPPPPGPGTMNCRPCSTTRWSGVFTMRS